MTKFEEKLCRAAFKQLLRSLNSIHSKNFSNLELSDKLIEEMADLNYTQQEMLLSHAQAYFSFTLNPKELHRQIEKIEEMRNDKELEDVFLLRGAPFEMMRRLFGMYATEFTRRREVLGIKGQSSGRPLQCDEIVDHRIFHLWQQHECLAERDRFMMIAKESNVDLRYVWNSLRTYLDLDASY